MKIFWVVVLSVVSTLAVVAVGFAIWGAFLAAQPQVTPTPTFTPQPTATPQIVLPNTFEEQNFGYHIHYPADWVITKPNEHTVVISGAPGTDAYYSTISIQHLLSTSQGGKYANFHEVVDDVKSQIATGSTDVSIQNDQSFNLTLANGQILVGQQFTAQYTRSGQISVERVVVVPSSNAESFFVWAYTSPASQVNTYLAIANAILSSWVITK